MRIGPDHLHVAEPDREHQDDDHGADRERQAEPGRAGEDEDRQHRLRAVRDRGEGVGGQHRQGERLAHPLLGDRGAAQRRSDQDAAQERRGPSRGCVGLARPRRRLDLLRVRHDPHEAAAAIGGVRGEAEVRIDRERALPHLARRHRDVPFPSGFAQPLDRTLVERRQLRRRADRLVRRVLRGRHAGRIPRGAAPSGRVHAEVTSAVRSVTSIASGSCWRGNPGPAAMNQPRSR